MSYTRNPALSVRDNICAHLAARFEAVQPGAPEYPGFTITWNAVRRAPLTKNDVNMGPALALLDGRERKSRAMGYELCTFEVLTEFQLRPMTGDDVTLELNRVLTEVQRTVMADIQCGGLSLNIVESSNELDIDGPGDRVVGGIAVWEVTYRHKLGDPRKLVGE